jgi:hypothetical protein
MESVLWAFDLVAVVLLCRWALARDIKENPPKPGRGQR